MNRLPTLTPVKAGAKIPQILDHMNDTHPEDAEKLRKYLAHPNLYAHEDIADALTDYCRANNLGNGVSETSVRRWRKKQR